MKKIYLLLVILPITQICLAQNVWNQSNNFPYSTTAIIAMGDSITINGSPSNLFIITKPGVQLFGPLWNGSYNAGYGGFTSTSLLGIDNTIIPYFSGNYNKRILLLMIGTNDANGGSISTSTSVSNINQIITDVLVSYPSTKIYVSTVLPTTLSFESNVEALNTAIKSGVTGVTIVDNWQNMENDTNWAVDYFGAGSDGIHPTQSGYNLISNSWKNAMIANGDY